MKFANTVTLRRASAEMRHKKSPTNEEDLDS